MPGTLIPVFEPRHERPDATIEQRQAYSAKFAIAHVLQSVLKKTAKTKTTSVQGRKVGHRRNPRDLSADASSYNGPTDLPMVMAVKDNCDTVELYDQVLLASTAGAVIADVYGSSPTGSPNWADWNTVDGEFRVLCMKVKFEPWNRYSKTTTVCTPGYVVVDRRVSTALTSLDNAIAHEACRVATLEGPWEHWCKMDGTEESPFQAVSGPTSLFWIKLYFSALSISITYGQITVSYIVQFRNRE